jgi:hypothetical protein
MANQMGKALFLTAVGGIVAGLAGCANEQQQPGAAAPSATPAAAPAGAKNCCAPGKNTCAGKGGCQTKENACAGKNKCAGKGGCAPKNKPADCPK